jgi:hypothetical protein
VRQLMLVTGILITSSASTQEAGLHLASVGMNRAHYLFSIDAARADVAIRWRSTAEPPPLSIAEATLLASDEIARRYSELSELEMESIRMNRVINRPEYSDLWYYVIRFSPPPFYARVVGEDAYFEVVLLMDGSIVEPIRTDR